MSHDELLKEINRFQSLDESSIRLATAGIKTVPTADTPTSRVLSNALRAVVTLCDFLDKKGRCCVPVQEIIQAIEKELK